MSNIVCRSRRLFLQSHCTRTESLIYFVDQTVFLVSTVYRLPVVKLLIQSELRDVLT